MQPFECRIELNFTNRRKKHLQTVENVSVKCYNAVVISNRAQVKPGLRCPNIALGAVLAAVYVLLLIKTPCEIRTFVIVENVFTVVSMCLGRIIFSVRAKKNED